MYPVMNSLNTLKEFMCVCMCRLDISLIMNALRLSAELRFSASDRQCHVKASEKS